MNILQFNVRLAEGGAAGVALDLHQRALQQGLASHFVYGYGKGGKESVSHQNYPQVIKHTPRMTAMANIALFRLFNRDLFGNFNELYRTITRTPGPVVLHFHVLHSYWLNLKSVVRFCEKVKNHKPDVTLVWTLHDHWSVTGRCAFTDGCEGWKTGCQKCPTLNNYPPVKIDRAHQLVAGKRQLFREMLALGCQFISPSQHVADAFNSLYGPGRCRIINNGIDMATEAILADLPPVRETQGKPKIAVVAHDLRYDGKTNQQLVREMMALDDKIELHTFGKFSPFTAGNVVNHGFETDKRKLMSALNQMDALVFSSRVDNYPLILCEALSIGVPVIATHSDAAREVLQKSGGKTVSEEGVLQLVQLSKPEIAQAIFGTTLAEFSQRSRAAYSGQQMLEEYVNFYQNL
ncbi:TPA: colanic acid biosynthesis glycosyltransferase WcaC [Escherichia coli]|uniref:colanic acid biosynthesis glycosyltransferase WcaC n=1 Tax=Escherichia coli TaxID=562 RepID=UPI000FB7BB43|nr:colanic acid biosynthesis glycosyltransferase WcaC [Escherichia coli]EEW1721678.1 colanic acid biosynthesis glycosyltransferase WcaC [Escherichia coli]EKM0481215.1 colanic acid biosynthesis glycosyltransferase WcaC [Escherichia coli]EMF1503876.1 colanic acid biosynthesis glycosyltransferase WcaC [Escherichia coli]MDF3913473.1 colanic acid biosynthesis glycosyltransferase WcaC [Escherichia coli]MEB6047102.1 colanic acid biosynthesis glycosyltransferase WcaC [Escherichia coli]